MVINVNGFLSRRSFIRKSIGGIAALSVLRSTPSLAAEPSHQVVRDGIAKGGSSNTITLSNETSSVNGFYEGCLVQITSGEGVGQSRFVTKYDGPNRVATVSYSWQTIPSQSCFLIWLPDPKIVGCT